MAEREGFEPPIPFQGCRFSRPEPSTARPPLRRLPVTFDCTSNPVDSCPVDPCSAVSSPALTASPPVHRPACPLHKSCAGPRSFQLSELQLRDSLCRRKQSLPPVTRCCR